MSDETTNLSVDDAASALLGGAGLNSNEDTGAGDATDGQEISQDDPDDLEFDDEDAGEDLSEDGDEDEEDTDEGEDQGLPPIDVPPQWDAEAAEEFKKLPRKIQELIHEREAKARSEIGKKTQAATEHLKAVENEAKALSAHRVQMEQVLSRANQVFADKWAGVDWPTELARNFQDATIAKALYDKEMQELAQLHQVSQVERQRAFVEWSNNERKVLADLGERDPVARKLTDPSIGPKEVGRLAQHLVAQGFPQERLNDVAANEMVIAYKAMLYDEAMSRRSQKTSSKNSTQKTGTKMRNSASPARPQSQTRVDDHFKNLTKSGSIDDAVSLILAQSNSKKRK